MNYQGLSLTGFILLGIFCFLLLITLFLGIRFKILSVIGDLSGATARKQIELARLQNELSGNKAHSPNVFNLQRGTLTTSISKVLNKSSPLNKSNKLANSAIFGSQNKHLVAQGINTTASLSNAEQVQTNATTLLSEETQMLSGETDVLNAAQQDDTVLLDTTQKLTPEKERLQIGFNIIKSVISINTNEIIK